jgi:hypothetical protein
VNHADRLDQIADTGDVTLWPLLCDDLRAASKHIAELEARYAVEVDNHRGCLDSHEWAMQRIAELEAEVHRLRHFAWVVEEHAENLVNEAAIALHPTIVVDVVKDGTIAYPPGHGPDDPPRPVQRHD